MHHNPEALCEELERVKDIKVLVEGPNDKRSLERLGFSNIVIMDRPLYRIVEDHQDCEEIILLTDLDEHGKGLYRHFYHEFTARGVRVNNRLRLLLLQTPVKHIESLHNYLQRNEFL